MVKLEPLDGVDGLWTAKTVDLEQRHGAALPQRHVVEQLLNRDDIVGKILAAHATGRRRNAPGHAAYLQSSTDTAFAYVAPMR
jgi:hypothetical protein